MGKHRARVTAGTLPINGDAFETELSRAAFQPTDLEFAETPIGRGLIDG